jgi:flagellar biosynthesis protein FliQ
MNEGDVVEILRSGFRVAVTAAGPAVLAALGTGLVVSILQTLTQIQEQTLSFVPKIVVTLIVTVLFMPLGFAALRSYMEEIIHLVVAI